MLRGFGEQQELILDLAGHRIPLPRDEQHRRKNEGFAEKEDGCH